VLKVFVDKNRDKRGVTADLSQFLAAIVAKKNVPVKHVLKKNP